MPFLLITALCIELFVLLSKSFWFFELFSHYTLYYAVLGSLFAVLALARRHFKTALIWATLVCINIPSFAPYLLTAAPLPTPNTQELRILSQNFYYKDDDVDAFLAVVHEENPDLILVHEASSLWETAQDKFRNEYPSMALTNETGIHGIFMASKIPGTFEEIPLGNHVGLLFTAEDQRFQVLGVHPNAPLTPAWAADRNAQFAGISAFAQNSTIPLVVAGDFNCTPWSPYFTTLLADSGLRDSRLGFGLAPTWHAHNPLFWLPIDHALVSPDLQVQNFKTTKAIDSDHRGILLDLSL